MLHNKREAPAMQSTQGTATREGSRKAMKTQESQK